MSAEKSVPLAPKPREVLDRCVMMLGFPVIYFLSPSFVIGCPWVISSMFSFYLFPISQSLPTHYIPAAFYSPASRSFQCLYIFLYILYLCISLICNLSPSRSFIFGLKLLFPSFVCFLCLSWSNGWILGLLFCLLVSWLILLVTKRHWPENSIWQGNTTVSVLTQV